MSRQESEKWLIDQLLLVLVVYPAGLVLGTICLGLRLMGNIQVVGLEYLWAQRSPLILVSNHPSLLEVVLLPLFFLHRCWWNPWRIPWSTPDLKNYGYWWAWLRPRAIFVRRGESRAQFQALVRAKGVLQTGGDLIVFPEGGRTCSGNCHLTSEQGKRLRPLKEGVSWLAKETGVPVVPVWVEGTDAVLPNKAGRLYHCLPSFWGKKITIIFGPPIHFDCQLSRQHITRLIEEHLLVLAD